MVRAANAIGLGPAVLTATAPVAVQRQRPSMDAARGRGCCPTTPQCVANVHAGRSQDLF